MNRRGFTLLEVLLAVTLLIGLSAGVYAFYQSTLARRADLRSEGERVFAERRLLDLMTEELTQAMVYPFLQAGMTGDGESFSFMRTSLPSPAVFVEQRITETPSMASGELPLARQPQHDVELVGFRLNRYEDEDGYEQIGGLERTCQRTLSRQTSEEGTDIEVSLLTDRVKFLRVQYWDGSAWADEWSGDGLPPAVRITLGAEPLPEDTDPVDYPYETVWRIVELPTAGGADSVAGAIASVRGGGRGGSSSPADVQPQDVFTGSTNTGPRDVFTGSTNTGPRDVFTGSTNTGPRDVFTGSTNTGPRDVFTGSGSTGSGNTGSRNTGRSRGGRR